MVLLLCVLFRKILSCCVVGFLSGTRAKPNRLLNGSTITSNDFTEMAAAVKRMADLNEIAPPRTLGAPEPQVVRGI